MRQTSRSSTGTSRRSLKPYVDGEIITPIDHNNPGDKFAETIKILKH